MINSRLIPIVTFIACGLTCLAYEAIRVQGWLNRFPPQGEDPQFVDMLFDQWVTAHLLNTLLFIWRLSLSFVIGSNPRIRFGWFLFSIAMLAIACYNIPGAMYGRWTTTADIFLVFYWVVVAIPAIAFIIFGLVSKNGNEHQQSGTS